MVGVQFSKHRFGRYKHHRAVGRYIGNNVFLGDVVDVFFYVQFELLFSQQLFGFG